LIHDILNLYLSIHAEAYENGFDAIASLPIYFDSQKNAASYFHSILRYIAEDEMKELSSHTVGIILHIFYVH